jgi:hypothetical protein
MITRIRDLITIMNMEQNLNMKCRPLYCNIANEL